MARKRSSVERCLHRRLCVGFLAFALLALATPSGAADEYDSTVATPSGAADEYDSTVAAPRGAEDTTDSSAAAPSGIWDDYDSKQAGHPVRIAAYVLHPVGVIIDRLILRPAWWIGSHEPFHTLFGRTD